MPTSPEADQTSAAAVSPLERDIDAGRVRFGPDGNFYTVTTWATVDLEPAKRGEQATSDPLFLERSDGKALLYPGRPHVFYGPSESLKSWAALLACKSVLDAGYTALYIDFEADEETLVERARIVGIPDGALGRSLQYIRPEEPLKGNASALADLSMAEQDVRPSLVILDGVTEAYALHGWDINKATDAAEFQKLFGSFADGTTTVAIDHAGKDASRGVVGSQHKRAGLNGAQYEFVPRRREGVGGHSEAEIRVTKDRHGRIRKFAPHGLIGRIHVGETVRIVAADTYEAAFGHEADTLVPILEFVETHRGCSTKAVRENVVGSHQRIVDGLQRLEVEKRIYHEDGPRNAKHWFLTP